MADPSGNGSGPSRHVDEYRPSGGEPPSPNHEMLQHQYDTRDHINETSRVESDVQHLVFIASFVQFMNFFPLHILLFCRRTGGRH